MIFCPRLLLFASKEGQTEEDHEEGTSVSKVFLHYEPIVKDQHLSKQRASIIPYSLRSQQHLHELRGRDQEKGRVWMKKREN